MKSYISKIVLATSLIFAFTVNINAQRVVKRGKTVVVKKKPTRVAQTSAVKIVKVKKLPKKAVVVKHNRVNYHFANNRFYKRVNGNYVVVKPAVGLSINFLPVGHKTVLIKGKRYYTHNNSYYVKRNGKYSVVSIA